MYRIVESIWFVATEKAWTVPYQGNHSDLLSKAITEMKAHNYGESYANFVPIVQSSGTGKSRLVDQVAVSIFTIPFNLRHIADQTGSYSQHGFLSLTC